MRGGNVLFGGAGDEGGEFGPDGANRPNNRANDGYWRTPSPAVDYGRLTV